MNEYELTGPTGIVLSEVPIGATFRYKTGKTWYVMLPHGQYINATKPGQTFHASSHGGWFDNSSKKTTLVVQRIGT